MTAIFEVVCHCDMVDQVPLGTFIGDVEVKWERDSNIMVLTKPFSFRSPEDLAGNPNSFTWTAPIGTHTDGASIPKVFWSIGHPFEAPYRAAAVLHDYECKVKERPWAAVHKMFYLACLCGGTPVPRAKAMYWAVFNYGPRWGGYEPAPELSGSAIGIYSDSLAEDSEELISKPLIYPTPSQLESLLNLLKIKDIPIDEVPLIQLQH